MPYIPDEKKINLQAYKAVEYEFDLRRIQDYEPSSLKNKTYLDEAIDELVARISSIHVAYDYDMAFAGLFNYSITRMFSLFLLKNFDRVRYWHFVAVSGILSNIESEFYRRVAVPYEDQQIEKNGDVPEYLELKKTIK